VGGETAHTPPIPQFFEMILITGIMLNLRFGSKMGALEFVVEKGGANKRYDLAGCLLNVPIIEK